KRLPPLPSPHAWRMAQQEALARRQAPSPIIPPWIAWNRYEILYFMVGLLLACVGWGGGTYLIVQRLIGENSPSIDLFLLSTAACVAFIGTFLILIAIARWRGYSWGEMGFRRPSIAWVMGAVVIGVIAIPARLALLFGLMLFIDIPEVSFIEAEPNAIVEMDIWFMLAL